MDLKIFKTLVNEHSNPLSPVETNAPDEVLLSQICACFMRKESDQACSDIRQIIDDLGLRYMCEHATMDPYHGVAGAILQALRGRGNLAQATSDWKRAVELAVMYSATGTGLPSAQAWRSNARVNCLSVATKELRKLGYVIRLPTSGGLDVPESEVRRLAETSNAKRPP